MTNIITTVSNHYAYEIRMELFWIDNPFSKMVDIMCLTFYNSRHFNSWSKILEAKSRNNYNESLWKEISSLLNFLIANLAGENITQLLTQFQNSGKCQMLSIKQF